MHDGGYDVYILHFVFATPTRRDAHTHIMFIAPMVPTLFCQVVESVSAGMLLLFILFLLMKNQSTATHTDTGLWAQVNSLTKKEERKRARKRN